APSTARRSCWSPTTSTRACTCPTGCWSCRSRRPRCCGRWTWTSPPSATRWARGGRRSSCGCAPRSPSWCTRERGPRGSTAERTHMKVAIVGAGIGGLVTALRLHAAGIDALPHAVRELVDLGLLERLDAAAIRPTELVYAHRRGPTIQRNPCGLDAGFAVPQFSLHRGRFQALLADAVRERIGPDAIRTGHRLAAIEQDADGVTARFTDREGT